MISHPGPFHADDVALGDGRAEYLWVSPDDGSAQCWFNAGSLEGNNGPNGGKVGEGTYLFYKPAGSLQLTPSQRARPTRGKPSKRTAISAPGGIHTPTRRTWL